MSNLMSEFFKDVISEWLPKYKSNYLILPCLLLLSYWKFLPSTNKTSKCVAVITKTRLQVRHFMLRLCQQNKNEKSILWNVKRFYAIFSHSVVASVIASRYVVKKILLLWKNFARFAKKIFPHLTSIVTSLNFKMTIN